MSDQYNWTEAIARLTRKVEKQIYKDKHYPGGQAILDPDWDKLKVPTCQHEYVDVGFMHPKVVCKFCDLLKPEENK